MIVESQEPGTRNNSAAVCRPPRIKYLTIVNWIHVAIAVSVFVINILPHTSLASENRGEWLYLAALFSVSSPLHLSYLRKAAATNMTTKPCTSTTDLPP
jgi:hypothetical protein